MHVSSRSENCEYNERLRATGPVAKLQTRKGKQNSDLRAGIHPLTNCSIGARWSTRRTLGPTPHVLTAKKYTMHPPPARIRGQPSGVASSHRASIKPKRLQVQFGRLYPPAALHSRPFNQSTKLLWMQRPTY